MSAVLQDLRAYLPTVAGDALLDIQRKSGFPLCLLSDDLPDNEIRYWWTPTDVAVLCVSSRATDLALLRRLALSRTHALEEVSRGLPLRANTTNVDTLRVSELCLECATLLRGHSRFASLYGPATPYLPGGSLRLVEALRAAIASNDDTSLRTAQCRAAALLVVGGLPEAYDVESARWLKHRWPKLGRHVEVAKTARPLAAVNEIWKWVSNTLAVPAWISIVPRNARVARPGIKILGTRAEGVLATDDVNTKGSRFSPAALAQLAQQTRRLRVMYEEHDRSRPPVMLILDARYHCHDNSHMVSIDVAALSRAGEERLARGGGFSPAVDVAG